MKRALLAAGFLFTGLVAGPRSAHAIANHTIEQVQKIVKNGKVVGARVHLLVSPESYKNFRVNLAPQKELPQDVKLGGDTEVRKALAGASKARFVLKQLKQKSDIETPNETIEMYVDIRYGHKGLKPGTKVNLLTAYSDKAFLPSSLSHMHIYGAWDGPLNKQDANYIIELPGLDSAVPIAAKTITAPVTPPAQ